MATTPQDRFKAAEKRMASTAGVPGTLILDSIEYPARIYTERGTHFELEGGGTQTRTLNAIVLCSVLPREKVVDENGHTRPVLVTHKQTSIEYRIDTGGVDLSPYGVYWTLDCSQPTAKK